MKKVILTLAALATVAAFTSCNKHCTCKTYLAGVVETTEEDIELDKDHYSKCSDMTVIIVSDPKTGVECESQLF